MESKDTNLDEWFDLTPFCKLLRTHPLGHFQWVTLDASNDRMGVWSFLGSLIQLLDNDDFLACLTS